MQSNRDFLCVYKRSEILWYGVSMASLILDDMKLLQLQYLDNPFPKTLHNTASG